MISEATIIIVNWNGGSLLKDCIQRLSAQSLKPHKIILVDNGSSDNSMELVQNTLGLSIELLGCNFGFAFANNQAALACTTKYIVLLNPDALAAPDWLESLVFAADNNPDIAVFGSRQMMLSNSSLLDGLGDCYHVSGLVQRDGYGQIFRDSGNQNKIIFSACACAVLYRKEAFESVGGFDEDYFCYVEDVDLGFRLRLAGYSAVSVPSAVVHHAGSASSGGHRSDFSIYHGHRNLVWTYIKNMPLSLFLLLLPIHICLNLYSLFYFSINGKCKVIFRAKFDALLGIPKMWRKRMRIQSQRRVSSKDIWAVLDKRLNPSRRK